MPTYIITDIEKKETFEKLCSWNELEIFLQDNPNFKKELSAPKIVSGIEGKTLYKLDDKHFTVEKGDVLHIPKGTKHYVKSTDGPRLSLTINMQ